MTMQSRGTRWVAMALAASLALATIAPAAEAGRKHKSNKRHHSRVKHTRVVDRSHRAPRVIVHQHRHDTSLPAFFGGLVLGAVISHAARTPAYADDGYRDEGYRDDGYYFYDPYCHERFVSLEVYHRHYRHHHHPRVVRVISVNDDRWIDSLRYRDDGWRHCDDDWDRGYDHGYDYRYDDRGYHRR